MQIINNTFDYYKDNTNEVLFHKSALLNIYDFNTFNKKLLKNKDKLFVKIKIWIKKI